MVLGPSIGAYWWGDRSAQWGMDAPAVVVVASLVTATLLILIGLAETGLLRPEPTSLAPGESPAEDRLGHSVGWSVALTTFLILMAFVMPFATLWFIDTVGQPQGIWLCVAFLVVMWLVARFIPHLVRRTERPALRR